MARLKKLLRSGVLTKDHITNKGYTKRLKLEGNTWISMDEDKFNEDANWDGLKGYITNTYLSSDEVIEQYPQL